MTGQLQTKDEAGTPYGLNYEVGAGGIYFWHTPAIGGALGFVLGNPGYVTQVIGGAAGFTNTNPGATQPMIGGAAGFTTGNPGSVQLTLGGAIAGTGGNPLITKVAGAGPGSDSGSMGWTIGSGPTTLSNTNAGIGPLALLDSRTVTVPGAYWAANTDTTVAYVVYDDGAGGAITVAPMDPAVAVGRQGGSADILPWFTGRVRIFGTAGKLASLRSI